MPPDHNREWRQIQLWYRDHPGSNNFGTMKMSMFRVANGFPRLKGKAAEIRDFGPPLLHVLSRYVNMADCAHKWAFEALQYTVRMEQLYKEHIQAYRLPPSAAVELFMCSLQFGPRVCALRRHWGSAELLYRVTGKLHIICHSCFLSRYVHPRFGACWSGEDYMRVIQKLMQSCLHGTPAAKVVDKAMTRYCHAFWHSLEASEQGRVLPMV